jgi:3-oxoacyl-[acyl-carrier-protein] synthase II
MSRTDSVWITGVGAATPLGDSYHAIADNVLAGKCAIAPMTSYDVSKHLCKIYSPIQPVPVPADWEETAFRNLDPFAQLLHWCSYQALRDSGLWERRGELRLGVVLGLGAELLRTWEMDRHQGGRRILEPDQDRLSHGDLLLRRLGIDGISITLAAACASGNYALSQGRRWVKMGFVDVCLAGAVSLDVTPMGLAAFGNLAALSKRNDDPKTASRPFDRDRDGFVMGEGGSMFVLEPADLARRRGARPYAELAGFGASSDAFHMVIPSSDPEPCARAVRAALADAAVNPEEVSYINAHATSTPLGDAAETRVLQMVFQDAIRSVSVSSTKSMTGHLLGAAAAVEALFCLAAMERQAVPPTINLDNPDCDLCHVPHHAREQRVDVTMSNSFGFGGSNTCLILRKVA